MGDQGRHTFLIALEGKIDGKKVGVSDFFVGKESRIAATWFSGTIIIPRSKEIGAVKNGEARYIYEKETHLGIDKGKLVRKEEKTFDPKRIQVWNFKHPILESPKQTN